MVLKQLLSAAAAGLLTFGAQAYPAKAVRIVVPTAPGGSDIVERYSEVIRVGKIQVE